MFDEKPYKLFNGDCLEVMKTLPSESVDCVISSPPYYQLRDYGFAEQWGLEPTFDEYLSKLWALMDEVKRVLKPTGTAWINLGDTYNNNPSTSTIPRNQQGNGNGGFCIPSQTQIIERRAKPNKAQPLIDLGIQKKTLLLIPHRFAIGCIERGWILRNDIVWAKRNAMPESVTDRFSKKHEYFFLMAKQAKYYFGLDDVRENAKQNIKTFPNGLRPDEIKQLGLGGKAGTHENGKNPGDIADFWDIPTRPSSAKHYATFNTELIDKPIKAGCPIGGTVLDMFCGTATTGVRALQLDRKFIGIDGNADYLEIAKARIETATSQEPLFAL